MKKLIMMNRPMGVNKTLPPHKGFSTSPLNPDVRKLIWSFSFITRLSTLLCLFFIAFLLVSCGKNSSNDSAGSVATSNVSPQITDEITPANQTTDIEEPSEYKESEEYKKLKTFNGVKLQVSEKGKPFYKASPELAQKMLRIFKGYFEIYSGSPHGLEVGTADTENYLYVFRYDGLKDIKILPDARFVFVGLNDYFYEDNSMGILLEALKHMKKQKIDSKTMYVETKGILQPFHFNNSEKNLDSIEDDINGDGKKETLEVFFDGELSLWVDGKKHPFDADSVLYFVNMQDRKALQNTTLIPNINLIPDKNEKFIALSFTHMGADNSHEEFYTMKYTADGQFKVFKIQQFENISSIYKNQEITLQFDDFNFEKKIPFTSKDSLDNSPYTSEDGVKPEEFLTGNNLLYLGTPQGYEFKDVNSDGSKELILSTFLKRESKFYVASINVIYALKGDTWVPVDINVSHNNG